MRFHVVGAGAVGGVTGGFLCKDGEEVVLVDRDAAHVAAIGARGLRVDGARSCWVQPATCLPDAVVGPVELALLAVPVHRAHEALETLAPHLAPDATVVTLCDGLLAEDLAGELGPARVVAGVADLLARREEPGRIAWLAAGEYWLGRLDGGGDVTLAGLLARLGRVQDAVVTPNVRGLLWSRACLTALEAVPPETPRYSAAVDATAREVLALAAATGVAAEPLGALDPAALSGPPSEMTREALAEAVRAARAQRLTAERAAEVAHVVAGLRRRGASLPAARTP